MSPDRHTGRPGCPVCAEAVGAAGGQAFRQARAQARAMGLGRKAHVPGEHPVADYACAAAERAEAAVPVCYTGAPAASGGPGGAYCRSCRLRFSSVAAFDLHLGGPSRGWAHRHPLDVLRRDGMPALAEREGVWEIAGHRERLRQREGAANTPPSPQEPPGAAPAPGTTSEPPVSATASERAEGGGG